VDIDLLIWLGGLVFVLAGWFYVASEWGSVDSVVEDGFSFRSFVMTRRFVRWETLSDTVQEFRSPLPRVILRRRDQGFLQLHRSFPIVLRNRNIDRTFLEAIRERFRVILVENTIDMRKW